MTASLTADRDAAAVLARLDPSLASLGEALGSALTGADALLHDVAWTPGQGCRLVVRRPAHPTAEWVDVAVGVDGWSERHYRDDPDIPGLRLASEPAVVEGLLTDLLGTSARGVRIEPVRYRAGARCVLRYDVQTEHGARTVYAKVVGRDAFDQLAGLVTALGRAPAWSRLGARVLGTWPELGAVLTGGVSGVAASAVLGDASLQPTARVRLAHALGAMLAELHTLDGIDVPRWTPEDQVAAVEASATAMVTVDAALGHRLLEVLHRLAALPPTTTAPVLCHGGFRAGQVIVSAEEHLTVLDVDGCCSSHASRDLASALAHLCWQGTRRAEQRSLLPDLENALVAGYRQRAPQASVESLDWWRATALLQVATRRYRRLETTDWPMVPRLVEAAARLADSWESRSAVNAAADLLDVSAMSALLGPLLDGHGSSLEPTAFESAEQLASAQGRRTVVSYSVRAGVDRPGSSLVVKAFTDLAKAQLLHQHLRLLHDGPFKASDLGVPEPLGFLPEQKLVLLRGIEGTTLSSITDPAAAVDGARRAGHWLARLHASGVSLPRTLSLQHEADVAREWSALVRAVHPDVGDRAEELAVAWAAALRDCPPDPQVALHKDFHAGHVLVGEALCVVDFDEARLGDPAFDVAHFATYLEAVPTACPWQELCDAFLESYVERSGWHDRGSFDAYCAYTWLKIAKQRALGSGPFPAVPREARRELVTNAIAEGERCLTR